MRFLFLIFSLDIFAQELDTIEEFIINASNEYPLNQSEQLLLSGPLENLQFNAETSLECSWGEGMVCRHNSEELSLYSTLEFLIKTTDYVSLNIAVSDLYSGRGLWDGEDLHIVLKDDGYVTTYHLFSMQRFIESMDLFIEAAEKEETEITLDDIQKEFLSYFVKSTFYRIYSGEYLEAGEFTHSGDFEASIESGIRGYINGDVYEGSFNEYDEMQGFGTYTYSDGAQYTGNFSEDEMHGYGEMTYSNGDIHKGNHHRGKRAGFGTYYYESGDKFVGIYFNGLTEGLGEYTFQNGRRVRGLFKNDQLISGSEYDVNGNLRYEGDYRDDNGLWIWEGQGTMYFYPDEDDPQEGISVYQGSMKDGQADGFGRYVVNDGSIWEGYFKAGDFTGIGYWQGPYTRREGKFEDWSLVDGKVITSDWEYHGKLLNDSFHGKGKIINIELDGTKTVSQVEYDQGVLLSEGEYKLDRLNLNQEIRLALVIGNGDYSKSRGYGNLINPENDAKLIASSLEQANFNVTLVIDATEIEILEAVKNFTEKISSYNGKVTTLFYYSGHGVQYEGENYLVPVNSRINRERDMLSENIPVSKVMNSIADEKRISIFVLDACRNNPYERNFSRSSTQGLARMIAPRNTYIAYSTSPGELASDGSDGNSIFTKSFAKQMLTEGLQIEEVMKQTRIEVYEQTNSFQVPWGEGALLGNFYFFPKKM